MRRGNNGTHMHACLRVFGPPNLGLSLYMTSPHYITRSHQYTLGDVLYTGCLLSEVEMQGVSGTKLYDSIPECKQLLHFRQLLHNKLVMGSNHV